MEPSNIDNMDRRVKWLLLIVSSLTLIFLVRAALLETRLADWRRLRGEYQQLLKDVAVDEEALAVAGGFEIEIVQNVVPDLGRTDRCITCHAGMEDPRMADQPQPFRTHPGGYLRAHDPAKFGCTICHEGQGLALEVADAHGRVAHWDYPMLDSRHAKTSCGRCHQENQLYEDGMLEALDDPGGAWLANLLMRSGRTLMATEGCLGCHLLRGKGGGLGPDITHEGDKTRHGFDFSHLGRGAPREVSTWLTEHFLDPSKIAPGSLMPPIAQDRAQAESLTAYMLSLRKQEPARRASFSTTTDEPSGRRLFALYCSSCHGHEGLGTGVPDILTPALNNADALAVAGDDFYRAIIAEGRSGTHMPAWKEGAGNLTRDEIDRIVGYIRSWQRDGARVADVSVHRGDARAGRAYYQGRCANCHGRNGEGGVGNTLNSLTFQAVASDDFLTQTIIEGRGGTAMPAWRDLSAQALSDILAFLRTWRPDPPSYDEVRAAIVAQPDRRLKAWGEQLYRANCASCHGTSGGGGIGPNLSTPDLLELVDDRYLYSAIVRGRPSTAMPAWGYLSAEDIAAILRHLRTWQDNGRRRLRAVPRKGDARVGEIFFAEACIGCHGADARGGVGPQLANPELLASATDELLFQWIARGRTGTAMKGFQSSEQGLVQLTDGQILDVIAYLRARGAAETQPILRTGVGNPTVGAQLFHSNCAGCHGVTGEGASGPQLNNPSFLRSASDGFLTATMVLGRTHTPMRSMVHGQEGLAQIAPEQVQDIIAFMRLWEYPATWRLPRSVAEITKRAVDSGREKFAVYCAGCHGPTGLGGQDGEGYYAPALNNPEFLDVASDGFLLATMARGRRGTPMPAYGDGTEGMVQLSADEMMDIVSFIRTWQSSSASTGESMP